MSTTDHNDRFLALFEPASLAIVGASTSPTKWGHRILFNTISAGYSGTLYAVNPKHDKVLGVPAFPTVSALPQPVDLAVIVVPPPAVPDIVRECAGTGVKAVVVITAGFAELATGATNSLQAQITGIAKDSGMLLVGPNCAGLIGKEPYDLCCGMPPLHPQAGGLAVVSQSGNVGAMMIRWAEIHQVGISRFVSSGNEAATRTEDFLRFFADDPRSSAILSYIEGVTDGRSLFEALRYAALRKPVVVVKGGRFEAGMKAAKSHTGSLAARTDLFRAACKQAGVALVEEAFEATHLAATFARQPLPKGRRTAIVTRGGGWGVLSADACAEVGLDVVNLPEDTLKELDSFLPGWWNRGNPVDLVAGMDEPMAPSRAVDILLNSPTVDAVVALGIGYMSADVIDSNLDFSHENGTNTLADFACEVESRISRTIGELVKKHNKPVVAACDAVLTAYQDPPNPGIAELEQRGIYVSPEPTRVARILGHMAERYEFLHGIQRIRSVP